VYTPLKAGNLSQLVETFPDGKIDCYQNGPVLDQLYHQMLQALDYLAFRGCVHRDIKPENILFTPLGNENEYLFQLADFGLASQQHLAKAHCGSPLYMAPEMVSPNNPQSSKVDVWSLFVLICVVSQVGGLHDPSLANYDDILGCIQTAKDQYYSSLSPMAEINPELRASAAQMLVKSFDGRGLSTPRSAVGQ
jgi:serine/threonine protein kinase